MKKEDRRLRIKRRIRKKISGTSVQPRLSIFRSNKEIYAQIIDDSTCSTLASFSSFKDKEAHKSSKLDQAIYVGKKISELATKAGIASVVFDRNGYLYHGRIKALAESAREAGLKF